VAAIHLFIPNTSFRFLETEFIDATFRLETQDKLAEGDLTPITESPLSANVSPPGVSRSRTLPSSRSRAFPVSAVDNVADNNNSAAIGHAERAKVLRKQKRSPLSQQPQSDWQGTTKEP
jgi:hypothetical protein